MPLYPNPITAAGDLTGTYPNPSIAANAVTAAKASTGSGATNLTIGNDSRLSDTRTPTDASVTGAKLALDVVNDYNTLNEASGTVFSGATAGTYVVGNGGNLLWNAANVAANSAIPIFYIDPANYALTGWTTYANVDVILLTNATAPGTITLTAGLYPVSAVAGGSSALSATIGAVTSGSTCAFVNPSSSARAHVNSGDFAFPSAGYYGFGVVTNATVATNAVHAIAARLSYRFST